jgi:hypothetical protein
MSDLTQTPWRRGDLTLQKVNVSSAIQQPWLGFAPNLNNREQAGWVEFGIGKLWKLDSIEMLLESIEEISINGLCTPAMTS